jgi:hypothetical protein
MFISKPGPYTGAGATATGTVTPTPYGTQLRAALAATIRTARLELERITILLVLRAIRSERDRVDQ